MRYPRKIVFREPATLNNIPSFEETNIETLKMKGMIFIARKYKQIHRKELTFEIKDWEKIERRAEACHTDTTKYLRKMVLETQPTFYDFSELTPLVNGMRIISGNINQIAKKVNATNNIYAEDVIVLRKEVNELSHIVNLSLSTLMSKRV